MVTNRYKIDHNVYMVRVREIDLISEIETEYTGVPLPFSHDKDRNMKHDENKYITVYLTIARMVEVFHSGGQMFLIDKDDVTIVHDILRNYIADTLKEKDAYNAPTEDYGYLLEYEAFADSILGLNKPTIIKPMLTKRGTRGDANNVSLNNHIPQSKEEWDTVIINKPRIV